MYLNGACGALIIGGGILASYFYRGYPSHMSPVTLGDGALVGLLPGGVDSVVYAMVTIPLEFVKIRLGFGLQELVQLEENLGDPKIPEAVRQMVRALFEGGTFSIGILFLELLFFMTTAVVFATIGGIVGVAMFRKKSPKELTRTERGQTPHHLPSPSSAPPASKIAEPNPNFKNPSESD